MLTIKNLSLFYDDLRAFHDISLTVQKGQWVTIVGANGAGKTSLVHAIAGIQPPTTGQVFLNGLEISNKESHQISRLGLGHIPEGRQIFEALTIKDNLEMGGFAVGFGRQKIKDKLEEIYHQFPRLKERQNQLAGSLSGGEQQMLTIGRCLMAEPQIILCDEPSLGLSPLRVSELFSLLQMLHEQGITLLLVEQNVEASLMHADYAYVLEQGEIILEGKAADLLGNNVVKAAYLGG
ncbi:MAG: ABC transporter ATP-binding protein [Alphaproteobacteria bacterium]|jgi:branched-chain amino acid transport system ATP-binding protein|nr:ABC transporter ATP-binding protein [Alphaproteobacteria bacterium]